MHPKVLLHSCSELLAQVLRFEHPADALVAHYCRQQRLGSRERATLTQTIYNVLRKKLLLTHLAQSGSGAMQRRLAILGFAAPRDFLVAALSDGEKHWLDQCDQVVVDDLLALHRHNLPQWLADAMQTQLGADFWPWVNSLEVPAHLDLRVNLLKDKRPQVQAQLLQHGMSVQETPYSPWGLRVQGKPSLNQLELYTGGAIEVQDEGSQLLALLVDAHRGDMVLDFCAGAGGKTLALGAAMRNTGRLYALDTSAHRLDALKPRLARSGLSNVYPLAIAHERDERIKRLTGKIDRVLVDAPCSGLGTLRRHPDLKWRQNPKSIAELAAGQAAILQSAARLLKPGGRLVYATCSVLPQENEEIAQAFSQAHKNFVPLPVADELTRLGVPRAELLCGNAYLRLWPHQHGTDGFFAAVWQAE